MTAPALTFPPEPSDEELLRAFVGGDSEALGELAARYENLMLGLARGVLRGRWDLARDAVQDTWVRVIRWGSSFSGRSSVKTWMYRILVNRCHDLRREAARREVVLRDARPVDGEVDGSALDRALQSLGTDHRLLLLLCYHQGLTHEEAAAVLEIPLGTLKSRLHGALHKLRAVLGPELNR